jgi:hypothetical protein
MLMNIILFVMAIGLLGQLIGLVFNWGRYKTRFKVILSVGLLAQSFFVMMLFVLHWGAFPWGRVGAIATSDNFLTAMKDEDYFKATQYMNPCMQKIAGIDSLGKVEETRPISWQWTEYKYDVSWVSTIGKVKFVDNMELPIEVNLKWNGYKWELYGVTAGEPNKDPRIHFDWWNCP